MTEQALATQPQGLQLHTMDEMKRFGMAVVIAGFLGKGPRDELIAKAVVSIQYGAELGIPPMAALRGINVINGKPEMSATLMAAKIKGSGKYDYEIVELTETNCALRFSRHAEAVTHISTFTIEDAKKAELTRNPTWTKFPRNMLFARALSNGARWFCADIFSGPVYVSGELSGAPGETVDPETGEVGVSAGVDLVPYDEPPPPPEPEPTEPGQQIPDIHNDAPASTLQMARITSLAKDPRVHPGGRKRLEAVIESEPTIGQAGVMIARVKAALKEKTGRAYVAWEEITEEQLQEDLRTIVEYEGKGF